MIKSMSDKSIYTGIIFLAMGLLTLSFLNKRNDLFICSRVF